MQSLARQEHEITDDEVRVVSVDFRFKLDDGETLTGTPTVTVPTSSGLVFTQKQVNASTIVVNGVSLAAGLAIQFKAAATAATVGDYSVNILCGTSAGQTVQGRVRLSVVAAE